MGGLRLIESFELFLKILERLQPILVVIIPSLAVAYWKISTKLTAKVAMAKRMATNKAIEQFLIWRQEESKDVLSHMQEICNKFKDLSSADQVAFLHFVNGTISVSGLSNMFLNC